MMDDTNIKQSSSPLLSPSMETKILQNTEIVMTHLIAEDNSTVSDSKTRRNPQTQDKTHQVSFSHFHPQIYSIQNHF